LGHNAAVVSVFCSDSGSGKRGVASERVQLIMRALSFSAALTRNVEVH
jgi:hypothetical protein